VTLYICIDDRALLRDVKAVWSRFQSSIRLPFAWSSLEFSQGVPIAQLAGVERVRAGAFVLRISPRLLLSPDWEIRLTLLHECLHLAAIAGPLSAMYDAKDELQRAQDMAKADLLQRYGQREFTPEQYQQYFEADHRRWTLAMNLANQLYEVDAEFALRRQYPECALDRARYYCRLRAETVSWDSYHHPYRPYAVLYERLRVDLALALSEEWQEDGMTLRTVLDREIAGCDPKVRDRIDELEQLLSPRRADFALLSEWGGDTYRDVVTRTIKQLSESLRPEPQ